MSNKFYWLWALIPIAGVIAILLIKPSGRIAKPEETIGFCIVVGAVIISMALNKIASAIRSK